MVRRMQQLSTSQTSMEHSIVKTLTKYSKSTSTTSVTRISLYGKRGPPIRLMAITPGTAPAWWNSSSSPHFMWTCPTCRNQKRRKFVTSHTKSPRRISHALQRGCPILVCKAASKNPKTETGRHQLSPRFSIRCIPELSLQPTHRRNMIQ